MKEVATGFGQIKQGLAVRLGGELVSDNTAIALTRKDARLRVQFYEVPEAERQLGVRVRCGLDRARTNNERAGFRTYLDGPAELLIRRKTPDDLKAKRWGLTREVQTADPDFDKDFYLGSVAPDEHLQSMLGSKETRRIVRTLLQNHVVSIEINTPRAGELCVEYQAHEPTEASLQQLAEEIEWLIEETVALKASLPIFIGNKKAVQQFRLVKWAYRFLGILLLVGVTMMIAVGAVGAFVSRLDWDPVDDDPIFLLIGIGLSAALLFVPLAYLFARGHSKGATHFLWLSLLGFVVFPPSSCGLGMSSNVLFDTSRPQKHSVVAVADPKYCSHDKHWVAVADWRNNEKTFNLELDNLRLCSATRRGDYFLLTVKEGFWGWPWIKRFRPIRSK